MTARPFIEEAPASSIVYCSQYRMEDYERPWHKQAGSWLRDVQAAYASDGPSPDPTPPGAQRKDQYVSDSDSDSEYGRDRANAARDHRHLLASSTGTCTCTRTTRASFHFVAMSQDLCLRDQ